MKKRKTQEEFEQELSAVLPNTRVLGKYININTKIRFKCLVHDFEFDAFPQNMLRGHGCRKCGNEKQSKAQTKSHDTFVKDLYNINPNIEVVGQYVNMDTKVQVRCVIDGYVWDADPRKLYKGVQCAVCSNRKVIHGINDVNTTRHDLVQYFKNKDEATRYTSGSEKIIDVVCPECGYEDRVRIGNLAKFGFSCNGCYEKKYGHKRVPYGYWQRDTMSQYLDENYCGYQLLDVKTPSDDDCNSLKAFIKCPNEKHPPYWAYWKNITSGYTCLLCYIEDSMSKGERAAESIFKKYNYVIDTHTSVAVNVYENYLNKTGDKTPTVIASTANPFKFNEAVISALAPSIDLSDRTEFDLLDILAKEGNIKIPPQLDELRSKLPRFNTVCEKDLMINQTNEFLN